MKRFSVYLFSSVLLVLLTFIQSKSDNNRRGKLFSIFQVVQFQNGACFGSDGMSGTCYTSQECGLRNGASIGNCANGFGVCCRFAISCGQMSSENLTIFTDTNVPMGMGTCTARICPINSDICQLRLDFERFQITGPSTSVISVVKILNGQPFGAGVANSDASQCNVDRFQVSSGSAVIPPRICGDNTGQHVFVDANTDCNELTFQFGPMTNVRSFQIRVTQYTCNSPNLAPSGCTQYFTSDSGTGTVQTFNFGNGHLADQNQVMCVRRNQNACRICWTTAMATDFDVSSNGGPGFGNMITSCCGPTTSGSNSLGLDCLSLPFAESKLGIFNTRSRFCGRNGGIAASPMKSGLTVCSRTSPFRVAFLSNSFEITMNEAADINKGVKLVYFQDSLNCPN